MERSGRGAGRSSADEKRQEAERGARFDHVRGAVAATAAPVNLWLELVRLFATHGQCFSFSSSGRSTDSLAQSLSRQESYPLTRPWCDPAVRAREEGRAGHPATTAINRPVSEVPAQDDPVLQLSQPTHDELK